MNCCQIQSSPYLQTFMACFFSLSLFCISKLHACNSFHFPQGTFLCASSELCHCGSELYGRYISVQEQSSERVCRILVIYSTTKSPAGVCCQSHWHHLRVTSKHSVGKNSDSCLQIQLSVMFFGGDVNLKVNWGSCCGVKQERKVT